MKLGLKHLAPYLDYELTVLHESVIRTVRALEVHDLATLSYNDIGEEAEIGFDTFKPILRPLSDYAAINSTVMSNINADIIIQIEIAEFANKHRSLNSVSYGAFSELIKVHADVFGLIEQGLAIDINTLTTHNAGE